MRDSPEDHRLSDLSAALQAFIASLPATRMIETTAGAVLLCHGVADNDMRRLTPYDDGYELQCNDELNALLARRDVSIMIGGHTHRRMVRRFWHLTVLNAGTLRRTDEPCVMLVDFTRREVDFHDIGDDMSIGGGQRFAFTVRESARATRRPPRTINEIACRWGSVLYDECG